MARKKQRTQQKKVCGLSKTQRETKALRLLEEKRGAVEPLLKDIVRAVLSPSDPSSMRNWVEVGSGLGYLRSLLPSELLGRVTHTERSPALVRGLQKKFPDAHALVADVTSLPFETESLDAVLGLCAFDSFSSPREASQEIGRVLRHGGRFIHFLDASTNIEPILQALVLQGRLPLPHFLEDIATRQPILVNDRRSLELIQPLHDILSVPFKHFLGVTEMLRKAGHPMTQMLLDYSSVFCEEPFQVQDAARTFVALTSDSCRVRPLNQALMSLFSTLQSPPYCDNVVFDLKSHSSLAGFKSNLEYHFGPTFGFQCQLSTIVYSRSFEANRNEPLRARLRRVGSLQHRLDWPLPLGIAAQELSSKLLHSHQCDVGPASHILREAAVYCFVAAKTAKPLP